MQKAVKTLSDAEIRKIHQEMIKTTGEKRTSIRNQIVENYLPLVMREVKNYLQRSNNTFRRATPEDLFQAGSIGLMQAIERYNPRPNSTFFAFAQRYIQTSIQTEANQTRGQIRIPRITFTRINQKITEIEKRLQQLNPQSEEHRQLSELKEKLTLKRKNLSELNNGTSLENLETNQEPLKKIAQREKNIREKLDHEKQLETAKSHLRAQLDRVKTISEKQKEILLLRLFGAPEFGEILSLRDAGKKVGITGEGVRRIEERTLHVLEKIDPQLVKRLRTILSKK